MRPLRPRFRGFTLVELLVVAAILSLLMAILFPVFSPARRKADQTNCLSNTRQLGTALFLYAQDYDETLPCGLQYYQGQRLWSGQGWAGECLPYLKNRGVLHCPEDTQTRSEARHPSTSYGYNYNLIAGADTRFSPNDPPLSGIALSEMNAPAHTLLLFEVQGVYANTAEAHEGAEGRGFPDLHFSASGNGLDNRLYALKDWKTSPENQYATGYLGGRRPFNPGETQFVRPEGRHLGGSNYLLGDGHASWKRGEAVSSGRNASAPRCSQDNRPAEANCNGQFRAGGTESPSFALTFSIR